MSGGPLDPAALSVFLTSLAHDLRSPLGVVAEALTELRSTAGPTDDQGVVATLADRGVQRLRRIADKMSLLAALESDHFELRTGTFDLACLVRAAAALAVAIEPRRAVKLVSEVPAAPCSVLADEKLLSTAVSEIVINALRHAHGAVRVQLDVPDGEARVAIDDDGTGVTPEERARLFRRFVRTQSRSGLGIGLSIAHDVIAAHGGTLTLEPSTLMPGTPGTIGARFVISLPLAGAR